MTASPTGLTSVFMLLALAASALPLPADEENILKNGEFQDWSDDNTLAAWTLGVFPVNATGCRIEKGDPAAPNGPATLRLVIESSDYWALTQYFNCGPGQKYRCRMRYKNPEYSGQLWLVVESGPEKIEIEHATALGDPLPSADEWSNAEIVFRIPNESPIRSLAIQVRLRGHGQALVQSVVLERLDN